MTYAHNTNTRSLHTKISSSPKDINCIYHLLTKAEITTTGFQIHSEKQRVIMFLFHIYRQKYQNITGIMIRMNEWRFAICFNKDTLLITHNRNKNKHEYYNTKSKKSTLRTDNPWKTQSTQEFLNMAVKGLMLECGSMTHFIIQKCKNIYVSVVLDLCHFWKHIKLIVITK